MTVRIVRLRSDATYTGSSALDIVEQMRAADFDPPPTARDYMVRAVARASHYFGVTMQTDPTVGTEAAAAERFIEEAIRKGFAEEVDAQ